LQLSSRNAAPGMNIRSSCFFLTPSRKRMAAAAFFRDRGADMTQKMPPVPPANRSPKGTGSDPSVSADTAPDKKMEDRQRNLGEQGRQGDIKQNTTNQGYQQDR
jgi:hypothetical protein